MLTRTDRRRFPALFAAIAVLALAGAALGVLLSTVQAQEDQQVLLSNTEQSTSDGNAISNTIVYAQGFTTGSNADGYHLASIELGVFAVPDTPANVTIALWSATSASEPDASVATLTHSTGTWATGVNAFDAPEDTELDANTTYFVHVAYSGGNPRLELDLVASTDVDPASEADWSIGQVLASASGGNWIAGIGSDRFKFRINGLPSEPTSETLVSNTGQTFNPGNAVIVGDFRQAQGFNTGSNAPGYRLDSIELHVGTVPNTPSDVTVELWSANSDSKPDASVATLTHSTGTWATGANTFNAPADTELDANTLYFVHVSYSGERADLTLGETGFTAHDSGEAAGWSVGQLYQRNQGSWSTHFATTRLRFKINGAETIAETMLINQPGEIRAYWNVPGHEGGNVMANCSGTVPFRAFWERPKRADEWEAEVKPEYGASNLSLSSIEYIGDGFHELTGTVYIREHPVEGKYVLGVVSIRVRGRFGDDGWGAWSRPTELFCNPTGGL